MVDVVVTADSERYDVRSRFWLDQVADLRTELRNEPTGFRLETGQVAQTKGAMETVVLALTSAGAMSAATAVFRAWLNRDRDRVIHLEWTENGRPQSIELRANALGSEATQEAVRMLAQRVGRESDGE